MRWVLVREFVLMAVITAGAYLAPTSLLLGRVDASTYGSLAAMVVLPVVTSYAIATAVVKRGRRAPSWLWWGLGLALYALTFAQVASEYMSGQNQSPALHGSLLVQLLLPWVLVLLATALARQRRLRTAGRTLLLYAIPMAVVRFMLMPMVGPGLDSLVLTLNLAAFYLALRMVWAILLPLRVDQEESAATGS